MKLLVRLLLIISFILTPVGCQKQPTPFVRESFLLNTIVTIKSYDNERLKPAEISNATSAALKAMSSTENRLSIHSRSSETGKINKLAGEAKPIKISSYLFSALLVSNEVASLTGKAFDPAIGPLIKMWRFEQRTRVPGRAELRSLARLIRAGTIFLNKDDHTASLSVKEMSLDLGGVAKGVAVDQAIDILRRRGLKSALVTTVSSTKVTGPKPGDRPWLIGIRSPRPKKRPGLVGTIELRRGSISTSGDYQQSFFKNGRRYHHVLDPKTGRPAPGFMSVTVVTDRSAAFADALSTGLSVMGRRRAMALVKQLSGVEVVFIDDQGVIWVSSGLKKRFQSNVGKKI